MRRPIRERGIGAPHGTSPHGARAHRLQVPTRPSIRKRPASRFHSRSSDAHRGSFSGAGSKDKFALGGAFIVIVMFAIALFAPVLASLTHGPNEVHLETLDSFGIPTGPQSGYPFGVDTAGRDLMVRVAYGARTSCSSRSSPPGSPPRSA